MYSTRLYLSVWFLVIIKIYCFFFFLVMVLVVKEGSLLAKNCGFFFFGCGLLVVKLSFSFI